jgi:flagellar secretion chaperone FliS
MSGYAPPSQTNAPKLAVQPTVIGGTPLQAPPPQVNAYLRTRVMSAKPEELRLLLIEGAIKFSQQGRMGVESKQYEQAFTGLSQAREIVVELMTSVRSEPNPELAEKVRQIYAFIYTQLVEGGFEKDLKKLDTAIGLLEYERETWLMLMQKLAEERGVVATLPVTAVASEHAAGMPLPPGMKPVYEAKPTLSLQG